MVRRCPWAAGWGGGDGGVPREAYQGQLGELTDLLVAMAQAATLAVRSASQALLTVDSPAAQAVVCGDITIDRLRAEVEELAGTILVRQQPVASDLRLVLASIRVAGDLERMGDLAAHVAKIALRRYPVSAVPPVIAGVVAQMATAADRMGVKTTAVLAGHDQLDAAQLGLDDDEMDALQRQLFALLVQRWPYGTEAAVDAALLGRFYERFADHAVSAAGQVVYVVTGHTRLDYR